MINRVYKTTFFKIANIKKSTHIAYRFLRFISFRSTYCDLFMMDFVIFAIYLIQIEDRRI